MAHSKDLTRESLTKEILTEVWAEHKPTQHSGECRDWQQWEVIATIVLKA